MPYQIDGVLLVCIFWGMLFAMGLGTFLTAWWMLKRDKLPPYDSD